MTELANLGRIYRKSPCKTTEFVLLLPLSAPLCNSFPLPLPFRADRQLATCKTLCPAVACGIPDAPRRKTEYKVLSVTVTKEPMIADTKNDIFCEKGLHSRRYIYIIWNAVFRKFLCVWANGPRRCVCLCTLEACVLPC